MKFNVTGEGAGFCRVDIPNTVASMWNNNYTVLVNGEPPTYMRNWTLGTTTYIYFTYLLSEKGDNNPRIPTTNNPNIMHNTNAPYHHNPPLTETLPKAKA